MKPAITINGRITASLFFRGTRLSGTPGGQQMQVKQLLQ